ncbi:RagB/SusD family nutrient uptake outer membrane protein [Bacteroides thetaiotaomicron]|nr:RagB/SusD family nutrient uptake outer membrane protein [Bacteroides thetaiotaomicron]
MIVFRTVVMTWLVTSRNLWAYSNKHTAKHWQWAIDNNLNWEGDSNKEIMYAYKFAKIGVNGPTQMYKNFFMLWQGLPTKIKINKTFPYGHGWALGSVCPHIWEDWIEEEPDDIRRQGSIVDLDVEIPSYRTEGFDSWEETMYRAKKFMPVSAFDNKGNLKCSFTVLEWGVPNVFGQAYITDFPLLRFADILLMHSELTQTTNGIDRVRNRVGLSPIGTYSLEALQNERRWELSFEGVRWNDIRRWHIAEQLLDKQVGVTVYNRGFETKMPALNGGYSARYRATNGGFWPIPQSQIDLSNGVLVQNKGWEEGDDFEYTGWH